MLNEDAVIKYRLPYTTRLDSRVECPACDSVTVHVESNMLRYMRKQRLFKFFEGDTRDMKESTFYEKNYLRRHPYVADLLF